MGGILLKQKMGDQLPIGQISSPFLSPASSIVDLASGKSGKKVYKEYRQGMGEILRTQQKPSFFTGLGL